MLLSDKLGDGQLENRMERREGLSSFYGEYVRSVWKAHGRELLKLALSGSVIKERGALVPPLSDAEAKVCVQEVFSYFLTGIEQRKQNVMDVIEEYPPESETLRHMLIPFVQYRAIDIKRKKTKRATVEREISSDVEIVSALHQPPISPEDSLIQRENSPVSRLTDFLHQAASAGELNDQQKRAFQLLIQETAGEISEHAAALELGVSIKRYKNLKSEAKGKLRSFANSRKGK
ncbi:hypothetical protein ACERZ8_03545 [Tateyamaria armeniaca]|uniref:Sigma-70 family RNA polymerase sigma factor n=1 Tax=Tateyamaria armeniaca TaxID=2518930 RepID=A0ABW8UTK7_9RHOB